MGSFLSGEIERVGGKQTQDGGSRGLRYVRDAAAVARGSTP